MSTDAQPAAPAASVVSEERPHPLTPLVQAWVLLVGAALFLGRQVLESPRELTELQLLSLPPWLLGFVAIVLVMLGVSVWNWWTTRFVVTDRELRVDHRGLQHESKRVAYTRIQSVDITQPFAARLLGMAQLTIDVGADAPIKLQYLSRSRAAALRDALLSRAQGRPAESAADDARVLLRVPPGELLLGALLSHDLLLLVLATGTPLVVGLVAGGEVLLVAGALIPLLLGIGGFLSKRVIGQFNYTLAEGPAGLRISRGLTSLSSGSVPVRRIQAIRIAEPVLWRRIGRARVDLAVLGQGGLTTDEDQAGSSSIMVPIGRPGDVRIALGAVWPGLDLDAVALRPAPRRARPAAPLTLRTIAHGWDDRVVVFRRGWWTRTTWIIPHARVQSSVAAQGPVTRRLGVARVALHTGEMAGRATTLMDAAEARSFVFDELQRARTARSDALYPPDPAR